MPCPPPFSRAAQTMMTIEAVLGRSDIYPIPLLLDGLSSGLDKPGQRPQGKLDA